MLVRKKQAEKIKQDHEEEVCQHREDMVLSLEKQKAEFEVEMKKDIGNYEQQIEILHIQLHDRRKKIIAAMLGHANTNTVQMIINEWRAVIQQEKIHKEKLERESEYSSCRKEMDQEIDMYKKKVAQFEEEALVKKTTEIESEISNLNLRLQDQRARIINTICAGK